MEAEASHFSGSRRASAPGIPPAYNREARGSVGNYKAFDGHARASWRLSDKAQDGLAKALGDLLVLFPGSSTAACGNCSCACHNGEDTPERLVYALLRAATKLCARAPTSCDVGVQKSVDVTERGSNPLTYGDTKQAQWVKEATVQACVTTATDGTTMDSVVHIKDAETNCERKEYAEDEAQTEIAVVSRGNQVGASISQVNEKGAQVQPETHETGNQHECTEDFKEVGTQLGMKELLRRMSSFKRGASYGGGLTDACAGGDGGGGGEEARRRYGDAGPSGRSTRRFNSFGSGSQDQGAVEEDFQEEDEEGTEDDRGRDSRRRHKTTATAVTEEPLSDADILERRRRERLEERRHDDDDASDAEDVDEELLAAACEEPMFKTMNAETQVSCETRTTGTNASVMVKRVSCQTDACFIVNKRARTPVRIGGGYHILPQVNQAMLDAAEEEFEQAIDSGEAEEMEEEDEPWREPVNTNTAIYGQPIALGGPGGRFAHGAAAAASEIERFLVGAYTLPGADEESGQTQTPRKGVIGEDMSHQLMTMYRVLRPRRTPSQPGGEPGATPAAQLPRCGTPGASRRLIKGRPQSARAAPGAAGGAGQVPTSAAAWRSGWPSPPDVSPASRARSPARSPAPPGAEDPYDVNIDGFTGGWARHLRGRAGS